MSTSETPESPEPFEPIPLTAQQIKFWDEMTRDEKAAKKTLEIAIQYHINLHNELGKRSNAWWEDFMKTHNLPYAHTYNIILENNVICVVKEKKEKEVRYD